MSIIILEGLDKCGKSSLASIIARNLACNILKCSAPTEDPYKEYVTKLLNNDDDNIIFDRFCYGELVYGPIYRGKSAIDSNKLLNLELLLQARDSILIYCEASLDFIKQKFIEDNETFTKMIDIKKLLSGYRRVISQAKIPVLHHQLPGNPLTAKFEPLKVSKVIIQARYIGSLTPQVVFVGDRNNLNIAQIYRDVSLPFDFGRSSTILKRVIKEVGLTSYGLTNAYKYHLSADLQAETLKAELEVLNPRVIIALGEISSKALTKINIPHASMWHPSFLGRFKGSNYDSYVQRLKVLIS